MNARHLDGDEPLPDPLRLIPDHEEPCPGCGWTTARQSDPEVARRAAFCLQWHRPRIRGDEPQPDVTVRPGWQVANEPMRLRMNAPTDTARWPAPPSDPRYPSDPRRARDLDQHRPPRHPVVAGLWFGLGALAAFAAGSLAGLGLLAWLGVW